MAITAFHKPSPLLNYRPIPFQAIAQTGDRLRKVSDDAFSGANALNTLNMEALPQDVSRRNELLEQLEKQTEEIYSTYKENPRQALERVKRLGTEANKMMTRGEGSSIQSNYAAAQANMKQIGDLYSKGKLTSEEARNAKALAMSRYKGIGDRDEFGTYASYSPYQAAFIDKSYAEQADDFITGWKANQGIGGLKRTPEGFISEITKKAVDPTEVYSMIQQHLRSQPKNMAYARQQADFATMGQDPNSLIGLPDGTQIELGEYKDRFITNLFEQASLPSAEKAGFSKVSRKLNKDWQLEALSKQEVEENPFAGDLYMGTSVTDRPLPFEDYTFKDGNISNTYMDHGTGTSTGALHTGTRTMQVDVEKNARDKAKLYDFAEKTGLNPLDYENDEQLARTIDAAEKQRAATSRASSTFIGERAKREGNEIARTLTDRTQKVIINSAVLNPTGTPQSATDLVDKRNWWADSDLDTFQEAVKKQLETKGISGVLFSVPGVTPGSPYIEITQAGQKFKVAFTPTNTISSAFSVAGQIMNIAQTGTGNGVTEGANGKIFATKSMIDRNTKSYNTMTFAFDLKDGEVRPNKPIGELTDKEISQYYTPILYQEGDRKGLPVGYTMDDIITKAKKSYIKFTSRK